MGKKIEKNNGIQSNGWFTTNRQEIVNNYGLNAAAVGEKLDSVYDKFKADIERLGVSVTEKIEERIRSIVQDSALAQLLRKDENAWRSEAAIAESVKANSENLVGTLLPQLQQTLSIVNMQAQKDSGSLFGALEKWESECRYRATRVEEACIAVNVLYGFLNDSQITGRNFLECGRDLLGDGQFTEAIEWFDKAIDRDVALVAEALFNKALARCYIQPVWDSVGGREIPLIHDITNAHLRADNNFKQAVKNADETKRKYFSEFADKVESVLDEYERIEEANFDGRYNYDCFVCVKQSGMEDVASDTDDFVWCKNSGILSKLEKAGIKTFFADRDLNAGLPIKKGSNDYNAFILHALQKAKVLLLVCSRSDYAQTQWVKNEYTRFMKFHKNPQIVLVSNNRDISIDGVTDRVQALPRTDTKEIVEAVGGKIAIEKDFVDPQYKYCEKCGAKHNVHYDKCIQIYNGKSCDGKLLSADDYANKRLFASSNVKKLQEALAREQEKARRLQEDNEKLKKKEQKNNKQKKADGKAVKSLVLWPLAAVIAVVAVCLILFGKDLTWQAWQHVIGAVGGFVFAATVSFVVYCMMHREKPVYYVDDDEIACALGTIVNAVVTVINAVLMFVLTVNYQIIFYWLTTYILITGGMLVYVGMRTYVERWDIVQIVVSSLAFIMLIVGILISNNIIRL